MILSMRSIVAICHYQDSLSKMKSRNRSLLGFMKHVLPFRHEWSHYHPPQAALGYPLQELKTPDGIQFSMLKFLHPESHPQKQNLTTSKNPLALCWGSPAVSPSSSCASPTSMIDNWPRTFIGKKSFRYVDQITISSSYLHQPLSL